MVLAAGGTGVYGAATGVAACGMLWYMPWLTRRSLFSAMIVTLARICANTNRNTPMITMSNPTAQLTGPANMVPHPGSNPS